MSEEREPLGGTNPPGDEEDAYGDEYQYQEEVPEGEGGQEPPEPDGDAEPEGEAAQPAAGARRPGRRERQQAELRELREWKDRTDRELQQLRQQQSAPPRIDPQEQARRDELEFQNALAQVPFEQQGVFAGRWWADKQAQRARAEIQEYVWAENRQRDKRDWDASCRTDKVRASFADRIEAQFRADLAAGAPRPREKIYFEMLGQEVDRRSASNAGRQRQAAERRLQQQRTQPGGARSDGARTTDRGILREDSYQGAKARLEEARRRGIPLWS